MGGKMNYQCTGTELSGKQCPLMLEFENAMCDSCWLRWQEKMGKTLSPPPPMLKRGGIAGNPSAEFPPHIEIEKERDGYGKV